MIQAKDWRTDKAQVARDQAKFNGKFPILEKHAADVRSMVGVAEQAIADCSDLGYTLDQGKPEQTLIWKEINTWLKSRLDWLANDYGAILDYKTTASANPEDFARQIIRMGYDMQAAFYVRGMEALTGKTPAFVFLVQEITPPYACSFIGMPPAFMSLGLGKVEVAIDMWRQCMEAGKWPAYPSRIHWCEPPGWAASQWEERIQQQAMSGDWLELANTP